MKKELWVEVKPVFHIRVTDFYTGEGLSLAQRKKKIEEDFYDYSVFMQHADYGSLNSVEVNVTEES